MIFGKNPATLSDMEKQQSTPKQKPWYYGHRERMYQKVKDKGVDSLTDAELLELLLMYAIPRRDVKPIVHDLLTEFECLGNIFGATDEELMKIKGIKENTVRFLRLVNTTAKQAALSKIKDQPILSGWEQLFAYASTLYTGESVEKLYILFLDAKLKLIKSQMTQIGTVNHIPIYPRDILKMALNLNASAVVLIHNHPSGDPHPSKDDILATREIRDVLDEVGIQLLEHLVIGKGNKIHSMKTDGVF